MDRPVRAPRADTREVAELKQIKASQPELASAVDMQLALVEMQRRVQGRVPLPWIQVDPEWMRAQQVAGRPLVRFADIPLEWSDFRLTFRQTADILQRFEALERADYQEIVAMGARRQHARAARQAVVRSELRGGRHRRSAIARRRRRAARALEQVLVPRAAAVSRALRRSARAAARDRRLDARPLSVLRMGT